MQRNQMKIIEDIGTDSDIVVERTPDEKDYLRITIKRNYLHFYF